MANIINLNISPCQVNLRHHKGFLGGLSTSGSTGDVAPYYSPSSVLQVIFHVSTLLGPGQADVDSEDICVTKVGLT